MDITTIEKQLEKIPPEIKKAFFSVETAEKIADIGKNNGLLLDKISDLIEETGLTMIGLKHSKDFVQIITERLNIEKSIAQKIANEINAGVLAEIKKEAQERTKENLDSSQESKDTATKQSAISSLETAGDFSIEKESSNIGTKDKYLESTAEQNAKRGEEMLRHIEDPKPAVAPQEKERSSWQKDNDKHIEPLADHLLSNRTFVPEEKINLKIPEIPKKPVESVEQIKKTPSGPDLYREPIE